MNELEAKSYLTKLEVPIIMTMTVHNCATLDFYNKFKVRIRVCAQKIDDYIKISP